jgi:hypothetical protein
VPITKLTDSSVLMMIVVLKNALMKFAFKKIVLLFNVSKTKLINSLDPAMTVANKLVFHMSPHHQLQNVLMSKVLKSQPDTPGMSTEPLTRTLHGTVFQKPASHVLVLPVVNPTVSPSNTLSLNATNLY